MKGRALLTLATLVLVGATLAGLAVAAPDGRSAFADAKAATAGFHDLDAAQLAGY